MTEKAAIQLSDIQGLRERCKRDLFFLAKDVLGYDAITEFTHRALADFFVQKDPAKPLYKQDETKDRLLLYPRGAFKSTFNVVDCIQWILCFPDIRILILTGASDLGDAFVNEITHHFTLSGSGERTLFQKLFPEHCIKDKDVEFGRYTSPARKKTSREPTAWAKGIDASLSGWHFDLIKGDDVVTNRNAETGAGRRKVIRNLHTNRKMLMPGGYWEMIGTRYSADDAYADMIKTGTEDGSLRSLIRPAMWAKPESAHKKIDLWYEDDVELLFPENLSFTFLAREMKRDRRSFFLQYMNDPSSANDVAFSIDQLRAAMVPLDSLPPVGDVFVSWDLAYSTGAGNDYTAGAVGMVSDSKLYVLDVVLGRFKPSELAWKIVDTAHRWNAKRISIEDSHGVRFIENDILRMQQQVGHGFGIDWVKVDVSNFAKTNRVNSLEVLLTQRRLFFSSGTSAIDETFEQLTQFGTSSHDDICDALAYLARFLPGLSYAEFSAQSDAATEGQEQRWYDFVYGGEPETEEMPQAATSATMEPIIPGLNC